MNWWQRLRRRDQLERELDAELQFHVERLTADYVADGLTEREARKRALTDFGPVAVVKDDCRQARGTEWVRDLIADARFGIRLLRKEPAFSAVAIVTLALGLGVNTVFFSIVNTYCLTGLPFPSAADLVTISIQDDSGRPHLLNGAQARVVESSDTVDRIGFYTTQPLAIRLGNTVATQRSVAYVSEATLSMIGEAPASGRAFRSEEYATSGAAVAMMSAALAAELFGSGPLAVGQTLIIDGTPTTIVGVLPANARFPDDATVWLPTSRLHLSEREPALHVFGRLRDPATTGRAAQSSLDSALRRSAVLTDPRQRIVVTPLNDSYRGRATDPVWVAFITAGALVVLIACSNVGNLLLARGPRRTTEIATRLSLGANRSRIVRQLLAETVVLVAIACVAAAGVASVALRALRAAVPPEAIPYWAALDLDWRAVGVLGAVGLITVTLSGLVPALQLLSTSGAPLPTRTTSESRSVGRWSALFLTVQLALSVVLLSAVGISVQVYRTLSGSSMPGKVTDVLSANLSLSLRRYPTTDARERVLADIQRRLTTSGEITNLSFAPTLPGTPGSPRSITGGSVTSAGLVAAVAIDPGYFATLGIPLLSGYELMEQDRDGPESAVLVNDRLARLCFGDVSVVGQSIRFMHAGDSSTATDIRRIAGVVPSIGAQPGFSGPPIVYVPRPVGPQSITLLVRAGVRPPETLASVVRTAVAAIDADLPLTNVVPLTEASWQSRWAGRVSQVIITTIASIGLCLAMVGVGALTAHRVASRTRELSIRMALGAQSSQLIRAVVAPLAWQLACGLLIGALLARGWERAFGSPIAAPDNLAMVAGIVVITTALCAAWPARRAAHADPIDALKTDA
jgi:predicted permease